MNIRGLRIPTGKKSQVGLQWVLIQFVLRSQERGQGSREHGNRRSRRGVCDLQESPTEKRWKSTKHCVLSGHNRDLDRHLKFVVPGRIRDVKQKTKAQNGFWDGGLAESPSRQNWTTNSIVRRINIFAVSQIRYIIYV